MQTSLIRIVVLLLLCLSLSGGSLHATGMLSESSPPTSLDTSLTELKEILSGIQEKVLEGKKDTDDIAEPIDGENQTTEEPPNFVTSEGQAQSPASSPFLVSEGKPNPLIQYVERPEDALLIVELAASGKTILDKELIVYMDGDQILVPLSRMMESLQFPVKVDPARGNAEGWFIEEKNTFQLDYPYKSVKIRGEDKKVSGVVESHIDEIYVSTQVLSAWFPINFVFSYNDLKLTVSSPENLPFQAVAERMSRWENLKASKGKKQDEANDLDNAIFLDYKPLSLPAIQMSDSASLSKSGGGGGDVLNLSKSVQVSNDLLWHAVNMSGTLSMDVGDTENDSLDLSSVMLNLSREDVRGNLLGAMKATKYDFGDVSAYSFPLAAGSQRGRGATVTNAPPNFVRDPKQFVIEGYGTQGWDVEVYQDERLLDFQKIGPDGRYLFEDIELREGFNLFRLVLYGPNGEKEERFEKFFLGQDMVSQGEFIYQMSALESSTPLFNFEDQEETKPTASVTGEYGITDDLSVYAGLFKGPLESSELNAVGGGARFSLGPSYTQLSLLQDQSGARSAGVDITGNVTDSISGSAGHTEHSGYIDEARNTVRETYARLSKLFSLLNVINGSYSFGVNRSLSYDGAVTNSFSNRLSANAFGVNFTNELEYSKSSHSDEDSVSGNLTLAQKLPIGLLRGRLNYEVKPVNQLTSGQVQFQSDLDEKTTLGLGLDTQFTGDKLTKVNASVDRLFEKFRLGLNGEVSTDEDIRIGANLTYSFVPRSNKGDYYMTSSSNSLSSGQVQIEPFVDTNANGVYDEGEKTIPDVTFRNAFRGTKAVSDKTGLALLEGISVNSINKITIDTKSLPEIYMMPGLESLNVYGKTGTGGPLYYPITVLGEISGTLFVKDKISGEEKPLAAIEMVLVDKDEKVVTQTYSEYDGFFSFQSIPMGDYKLYLPESEELKAVYHGSGDGPPLSLSGDKTEMLDLRVVLEPDSIIVKEADEE